MKEAVRALIAGTITTLALLVANAIVHLIVGTIVRAGFRVAGALGLLATTTWLTIALAGVLGLEVAVTIIKSLRRLPPEVEDLE